MLIDANVILRFLIGDDAEMLVLSREVIGSGKAYTLPAVLAEVVYVLNGHYEVERTTIRDTLKRLLDQVGIEFPEVMKSALDYYADRKVDFVDAILISGARLLKEPVYSFDKKLNRLMEE